MNIIFTPGPKPRRPALRVRALVVTPFTREDRLVAVRVEGMYLCEYLNDRSLPVLMRESEVQGHVAALGDTPYQLDVMDWM